MYITTRLSGRFAARAALLTLGLMAAAAPGLRAQNRGPRYILSEDPNYPNRDLQAQRSGFRLFANADLAFTGLRSAGNQATYISNMGPCVFSQVNGDFCEGVRNPAGTSSACFSGVCFSTFELTMEMAAGPSDWNKGRLVNHTLDSVLGGGYTALENFAHGSRVELGPDDGSLGRDFTGVLSTANDGSCNDHNTASQGFMHSGLQLLPTPSCPQTLVGEVFAGDRPVTQATYEQLAGTQGTSFRWDFWRVPDALKNPNQFLGNNFNTYGAFSDHYKEALDFYGRATPLRHGAPLIDGWPLGVTVRFDTYNFTAPSISSAYFYQLRIINNSRQVYGAPISYDSLYFGLEFAYAWPDVNLSQSPAYYFEPQRGAMLITGNGSSGSATCNGAAVPAGVSGCLGAVNPRGFRNGASAVMYLSSPIGDLRNKLFTRAGSSFFGKGNPATYGDTIPMNVGHICSFGSCFPTTWAVNDRRGYGMMSSHSADVLDGRAPGSLSAAEHWRTFRNRRFPLQDGLFNTMVPGTVAGTGSWDWNHDGVQDTLYLDTCGGPHNMADLGLPPVGCVRTFADTMPGKQNDRNGNTGGTFGVGPFRLAGDDTVGILIAVVGERDSVSIQSAVNAVIDAYLSFFLLPEAPPVVRVARTEVTAVSLTNARQVRINFTDDPNRWVDPFLTKAANDIANAAPGATNSFVIDTNGVRDQELHDLFRLRNMNPGLVAAIRARAADNFGALEIYRSCDGGGTFATSNDCINRPAVDNQGRAVGTGFRAYATISRVLGGPAIASSFVDGSVTPGRTYLYTFVSKSRGGIFTVVDTVGGKVVARQLVLTDSIGSSLSRSTSDPQVVSIYIPASREAGSSAAQALLTASTGGATVPFTTAFAGPTIAGTYTADFGNKIVLKETRNGIGAITRDSVFVRDEVQACSVAPPTCTPAVTAQIDTATYVTTNSAGVAFAGTPTSTTIDSVSAPPNRTTTWTFSALGFILSGPNRNPLFISTNLVGDAATPGGYFNRADFAGFTISANNTVAGTFSTRVTLAANGDTINAGNITAFSAQWRSETSVFPGATGSGGTYRLTWASDPFGLTTGFVLNFGQPTVTEAELAAALGARPGPAAGGYVGLADAATATLTGIPLASLVAAKIPFQIVNTSFGNRPVDMAFRARASNAILLGSGNDTVRVNVPADQWVPGDPLQLIETVDLDSTVGGLVVLGPSVGGALPRPIRVTKRVVTFTTAIVGCSAIRESCNPVRVFTQGASGYVPLAAGTQSLWSYLLGLSRDSRYTYDMIGPVRGDAITSVTQTQLDSIRVVPNPYVVFSAYQPDMNTPRVLFTHLPPSGSLRVYTVSGQFVQQINWTAAQLNGRGDLYYDLRTREGTDLASGLYVWVLTTTQSGSGTQVARGKFVIIRGRSQ
jgi:hypothetical protein